MLQLFKPRIFIKNLSSSKINFKLIGMALASYVLMLPFNLFGHNKAFDDIVNIFRSALSPFNQSQVLKVSIDIIVIFLVSFLVIIGMIAVVNLIVKGITLLLKKKISYYSLLNISVYSIFLAYFLNLILILVIFIFYPLVVNFSENQIYIFVMLPMALINIFSFIMYIYGIIITIRTKIY